MTPYATGFADDDDRYAHYVAIAHAAAAHTATRGDMPAGPAKPAPTSPSEAPVSPSEAPRQWVEVEPPSIYQAGFKYVERPEPVALRAAGIIAFVVLGLFAWFGLRPEPGDPPPDVPVEVMEQWNCGKPYPQSC